MSEDTEEAVAATSSSEDKKSIDLCERMDAKIAEAEKEGSNSGRPSNADKKRVTLADVNAYNHQLVTGQDSDAEALRKYMRHERLYKMMKDGALSKDKSLWHYLHHFAEDRARHIERLSSIIDENDRQANGPKKTDYDATYLQDYFANFDT